MYYIYICKTSWPLTSVKVRVCVNNVHWACHHQRLQDPQWISKDLSADHNVRRWCLWKEFHCIFCHQVIDFLGDLYSSRTAQHIFLWQNRFSSSRWPPHLEKSWATKCLQHCMSKITHQQRSQQKIASHMHRSCKCAWLSNTFNHGYVKTREICWCQHVCSVIKTNLTPYLDRAWNQSFLPCHQKGTFHTCYWHTAGLTKKLETPTGLSSQSTIYATSQLHHCSLCTVLLPTLEPWLKLLIIASAFLKMKPLIGPAAYGQNHSIEVYIYIKICVC